MRTTASGRDSPEVLAQTELWPGDMRLVALGSRRKNDRYDVVQENAARSLLVRQRLDEVVQCVSITHAYLKTSRCQIPDAWAVPASFSELAERLIDGAGNASGPWVEHGAFAWPLRDEGFLFALLERNELPDYDRVVLEVLVEELAALLEEVGDGRLGTDE
ncbi:MAG: hypothetical protein AAFU79_33065, partial [Myxococcota bacterium]